jgi:4-hydroxy-2-oxoheptanedioate aldolase
MDMPRNQFKRTLAAGGSQIGLFLGLANSYTAEILAGAGFDFLLIDAEHGPNDVPLVLAQLQAIQGYPVNVVVRPANDHPALIKQLLDIGAQTLLVPMVESAAQAKAIVSAMRYPPHGFRGVGTALARAARWNGVDGYFEHADAEMCLIVQVESRTGLDNLDAILAVEGVDGVFLGPADLAASLGHLGQPGHPEVKAAIDAALAKIAIAGKIPGVFSGDPAAAALYREKGARFIAVGADTTVLRNAAVKLAESFKSGGEGKAGAAY